MLLSRLPRAVAIGISESTGQIASVCFWRIRRRAVAIMSEIVPDQIPSSQREVIAKRFFSIQSRNIADVIRMTRHFKSELLGLVQIEGKEHWLAACASGKGVIGVGAHLGNFELMAACLHTIGEPMAVIGRELYDSRIHDVVVRNREAVGLTNLLTSDSPRSIVKWLSSGKTLGVLIDTESHRVRSIPISAFGRLSNTPIGPALIALKLGAAVCPVACVRMPGDRYKLIIRPAIPHPQTGDRIADAAKLTHDCTAVLDEIILAYPDQWIWFHDRWRSLRDQVTGAAKEA